MSVKTASPGAIQFCDLCNKPIASDSAYKRHVSYCRRTRDRPKKRPRSCKECHSAKAKCSFEPECSRCRSKGIHCVYEKPVSALANRKNSQHGGTSSSSEDSFRFVMEVPCSSFARLAGMPNFGSSTSLEVPASSPRSIIALRADPVAQQSAKFILESFRGLPFTMISRETFSWFNHGYWFQSGPPQNIMRCSDVANLYADRKSLAPDSFWTVINQENKQLLRDLPNCSMMELQSGMQAQIIYMIMFALDNISSNDIPEITLQMLMTFELYGKKSFETDNNVWFPVDRLDDPKLTWEDWVCAETQRRCTITWFLLSRVIDLKFGVMCPSISNCRRLQLPSPGSLWNARTRNEWEAARRIHCRDQLKLIRKFGDLIEARSCPPNSDHGQELNRWHANCDKLGLLLTLATTMV
ncbi:uncharacterized protein GGS22DRAFT_167840 [Annulohypoxylon maeteangense]|uniref:uncharacterized protein n=1 Tax=Annulohypoxylon maeteangense TaxID=1927788 RepID=UPI002008E619|nr:uncharacterized protein GGS22DRAFT_167840 [Annulohypoxylon maeteangense]KAI0883076.1 hypothetical protein GGS22DRAFT_167840 [Annulohypoxylon maeteangense]